MDSQSKSGRRFKIRFTVSRRGLSAAAALVLICVLSLDLSTESMTLTTYYPAPYGAYKELRATKNAYFAYVDDGSGYGTVGVGPGGDALTHSDPDVRLHVTQDVALKRIVGVDSAGTGLNSPGDYFVDMGPMSGGGTSASFQGAIAVGGVAGDAVHPNNGAQRIWITKNYIHLPDDAVAGCTPMTATVTSANSNSITNECGTSGDSYAAWQPGIYQEGKSHQTSFNFKVDTVSEAFVMPIGKTVVSFTSVVNYWCCPTAIP